VTSRNTERFKEAMSKFNTQKSELNAQLNDLRNQLKTITAERDTLQAQRQGAPASDDVQALMGQVDGLIRDKAALEAALADAKATNPPSAPAERDTQLEATIVRHLCTRSH
jgi:phage shock protein A